MEKNKKEKKIDTLNILITESLCYTPETNTILYINYTSIKKKKIQLGKGNIKPSLFARLHDYLCRKSQENRHPRKNLPD